MALAPSSPRLPSPPPPAEIQISPNSPSDGAPASSHGIFMEQSVLDANSKRRIHPGTKAADMATGPPLVPLSELDSAFQLQEHLAALHYHHTDCGTQAITREAALQIAQPPSGIDRTIWLYELCRFLISRCNSLIVGFLFDTPPCSATTCPEMRASEWQFLCAVHEQPKSCCAIDYCCHTLDWAANVVSDQKLFPSRFAVFNDVHSKNAGVKNLVNVFRRLHRIFAHAWFQHRSVFWSTESQMGLYIFFKTVCDLYDLLPAENYKLPPEAEGLEVTPSEPEVLEKTAPPTILKPPSQQRQSMISVSISEEDSLQSSGRTNTRRHIRSSPSTGSAVTTVIEADEEDTDNVSGRMRGLRISGHQQPEVAEVPVIVESFLMTGITKEPIQPAEAEVVDKQETHASAEESETDETIVEFNSPVAEDKELNVITIQSEESPAPKLEEALEPHCNFSTDSSGQEIKAKFSDKPKDKAASEPEITVTETITECEEAPKEETEKEIMTEDLTESRIQNKTITEE